MTIKLSTNFVFPQWFAGLSASLLNLQLGFMNGWTSPALIRLTAPDSSILLDSEQASWVASLLNFSRLFGAVAGPMTIAYLGSKRSISVTLCPIAIGWILIALADRIEWLYASRLFSGLGLGMATSIFPLYIGEVSMPKIRGALISFAGFGSSIGQVIASVCGSHWSLTTASIFYLVWCFMSMGFFCWLPESPHHLMKVEQKKAAKSSIHWYRAGRDVDGEFEAVEKFVNTNKTTDFISLLREFKSPSIRRATIQIVALYSFVQLSGLNSLVFYMETILSKTNFTLISPSNIVTYVFISGTCASALSIFLIDFCGRRILLLISSIVATTATMSLMLYFLLIDLNVDTKNVEWVPMVSMFLFMIAFMVGLLPVPNSFLSETFPAHFKCLASCIASLISAGMAFMSVKTYQPMVGLMGETYVFLCYAICSSIVIPYVIFLMPETKGKSLQQIQDEMVK